MNTLVTVFTGTLVQESPLSVSGIDRASAVDSPLAMVDGKPILAGRGLKGAAVAMARRFFDPLPRSVSESLGQQTSLRRSAWEFASTQPQGDRRTAIRANVGILQKTAARAKGVLFDTETVPTGTRWPVVFRVDWRLAGDEAEEAEGILGYVLSRHWAEGRCWLGGSVARGLGWCRVDNLFAHRLDSAAYETWIESGRTTLRGPLPSIPTVEPTRSWHFRTRDVRIRFGEYVPEADGEVWGLDMLAVGVHDSEQGVQRLGDGQWARPTCALNGPAIAEVATDRPILMDGDRPVLPGSTVRGPLRHALSRAHRAAGETVTDPHEVHGKVGTQDVAGKVFGTVDQSSRVLIRDGIAEGAWAAARLHMHAEDEFSAGSYGSAKRDAVRLLRGTFPIRIVIDGPDAVTVNDLAARIERQLALGALSHLPVGGHKTRGAGWGRFEPGEWQATDVVKTRDWASATDDGVSSKRAMSTRPPDGGTAKSEHPERQRASVRVSIVSAPVAASTPMTLGACSALAKEQLAAAAEASIRWWCEPAPVFPLPRPIRCSGIGWPVDSTPIEEAIFFSPNASCRIAPSGGGWRMVTIAEVPDGMDSATAIHGATVIETRARLHGNATRFANATLERATVVVREWHVDGAPVGFTMTSGGRR
ncbi:MAG: hypothetical protein KF817_03020 [Phycisphaeraceae bacterium]|nr:hypothetical protein [Phycisphaeraceae bacterium]